MLPRQSFFVGMSNVALTAFRSGARVVEGMELPRKSPEFVRVSTAAAMTLGLKPGRFWRNARLHCINLLLTHGDGCAAACAYCGLSRVRDHENKHGQDGRATDRTFIRVQWPTYALREILDRLSQCSDAQRICISMITHRRALEDTRAISEAIRREGSTPISALITPTLVDAGGLERLRACGVDKIGIAIDAATPQLFGRLRGASAGGPHRWETYWERFGEAVGIFGKGNVGSHFIVGLGETERDLVGAFQTVHDLGGVNHLFSFFPEPGSPMDDAAPPPMDSYRRVQLAAHLIDSGIASADDFTFDPDNGPNEGRIRSFGIADADLDRIIAEGEAFRTRGCTGADGQVACNRPFANSLPGPGLRNYPFPPEPEDIERIRLQLAGQWSEEEPREKHRSTVRAIHELPQQKRAITFFAPSIKHFDTDEFENSRKPVHIAVSVTGRECNLQCLHCGGCLLKGTYSAETPQALWDLAVRLKPRGLRGMLITGGCNDDGIVPLAPFCATAARLKSELGLRIAIHSKLVDRPLADALCGSRADAILLDVVGSLDMLQRVYRLADKTLDDIRRSLDLLEARSLPMSPHVVLSNLAGADGEGNRALALLEGRRLHSLVIVLLMPLPGCDVGPTVAWDVAALRRLFEGARAMFPTTPLLLGCARPLGRLQKQIDAVAVESGFDGIAYPSEGTVAHARQLGREIRFSEFCCSLMI